MLITTNNVRLNRDRLWELLNETAAKNCWSIIVAVNYVEIDHIYKVLCEKNFPHRDHNRRFLVTHFNRNDLTFGRSTYDLTLKEAVDLLYL